jgi:polyisoprenoid-binding protein YceI
LWQATLLRWQAGVVAGWVIFAGPTFGADSYAIDSAHSIPVFEFSHLGLTTQSGRFDNAAGLVVLDPGARKGSVTYEIETASLNMGFGTENPSSPGYQLFDVDRYPKITFRSSKLIFDSRENVIAADGLFTLLGVTKPLRVTVSGFKCSANPMNRKEMCAGNVTATIRRSDFGMVRFIPAISDEVKISVPVEAYKN